ncbi:hypothetical protein [Hymenobacter tenuis]
MKINLTHACLWVGLSGFLGSCGTSTDKEQAAANNSASSVAAADSTDLLAPCNETAPPFEADAGRLFSDTAIARGLTRAHRNDNSDKTNCNKAYAFYFNEDSIKKVLDQDNAVGFRVYLAKNTGNRFKEDIIIVAVDKQGNDLFGPKPSTKTGAIADFYKMLGTPMKCPYNCDTKSGLYDTQ